MKSFKDYLEEKILFNDIEDIRQHISPAFIKLFGNKRLTGEMFYKELNKVFNSINISVYRTDGDFINGSSKLVKSRMSDKSDIINHISLYIPLKYYKLVRDETISQNSFFHKIAKTIEHELIHKKQIEHDKREHSKPTYKWYDDRTQEFYQKYLSDKNEIMAFAKSIVELYKADGLSKDEINNALKSLDIEKYPNRVLKKYLETFDKTDPIIKRLLSYTYQYNM